MASVFLSYSHKDENLRDALESHLAMLKREGSITLWHDRELLAGDEIDQTISSYLLTSDIIILLVSSDFLSSYYCYEREMLVALERHRSGSAKLIPIILKPCDWASAPFSKAIVLPKNGKPLVSWANIDEAFLDIVTSLRKVLTRDFPKSSASAVFSNSAQSFQTYLNSDTEPRSSNMRLRKEFTQAEKDKFLDDGYDYIRRFFENSLKTLSDRNEEIDFRLRDSDRNGFNVTIYRSGKDISHCSVFMNSIFGNSRLLCYLSEITDRRNGYNIALSTASDNQMMFFNGQMSPYHDKDKLSYEGAAELFWGELISRLQ